MSVLEDGVYKELEELFDALKKSTAVAKQESGDKGERDVVDDLFRRSHATLDAVLANADVGHADYPKALAIKASLHYEEAKIRLSLDDFAGSKEQLQNGLEVIEGHVKDAFIKYLHLRIVNHISFALSKLGEYDKARELLEGVTDKEQLDLGDVVVYSTEELVAKQEGKGADAKVKLHSICINNLQMLSWVYGKLGMENESALMQHRILELELDFDECDPVDWALRCTRVASLYLVKLQFVPARYYLSAAGSALDRVEVALIDHPDLGKAQAELARGWIYYGLRLFDTSKSRDITKLCNRIFDDSSEEPQSAEQASDVEEALDPKLRFPNSEVKIGNVPAKYVTNTTDAHRLFQYTQMWLKRARVYYTLRDYPFVYVNCVLDLSELYRFLAFYEPDLDAQYNVQRRRAEALETLSTILKEVRPQCYVAVSVELLRELAEVQIELMGINLKRMYKMHDAVETHDSLRRRMEGVCDIQNKLEKIGNMFGHSNLEAEASAAAANAPATSDPQPENEPLQN